MKPIRPVFKQLRASARDRGLALITVLSLLSLITIVVLAFFSLTQSEYRASQIYSRGQTAKTYGDTALNIVIGQIRSGSERDVANTPVMHATQPGMVRKYNTAGGFVGAYKLYSDEDMVFQSNGSLNAERAFVTTNAIPANWNAQAERYVDLNEPVVRALPGGSGGEIEVFFPIIDPRAAADITPDSGTNLPVEGFSYSATRSVGTGELLGVVTGGDLDDRRVPMPVQWLYILADGEVGTLDPSNVFNGKTGAIPSDDNPIVGRVAFWTDDESCKINVNTAGEPSFMGKPTFYHERDHSWGDRPPTAFEYQRFPGHPATVAMSSVFYPNPQGSPARSLEIYADGSRSRSEQDAIMRVKTAIYGLMPRIHTGGSIGGTLEFAPDDFSNNGQSDVVQIIDAINERLYPSVDEMFFTKDANGTERQVRDVNFGSGQLFDKTSLSRLNAFLTASSRASESNLFGLPKVAMWPIADENQTNAAERRTGYDSLIAFCSTLGGQNSTNQYFFRRADRRDPNGDININRNRQLMSMLDSILTRQNFPAGAFGRGGRAGTFAAKYGVENVRQLLVNIFDYVRSTNLYDGYLAPDGNAGSPERSQLPTQRTNWSEVYTLRDRLESSGEFKTFTPGPFRNPNRPNDPFQDRTFPGYGQVTGSKYRTSGGVYKGFGRTLSISEIGLHFICTADGENDRYSWRIPQRGSQPRRFRIPVVNEANEAQMNNPSIVSGGRTALQVRPDPFEGTENLPVQTGQIPGFQPGTIENLAQVGWEQNGAFMRRYYSNYAPFPRPGSYGTVPTQVPPTSPLYPRSERAHPGFDPENWNATLERGQPLGSNEKRIQAALHFEMFTPAVGYPQIHPEFTIVLVGSEVNGIEAKDGQGRWSSLFSTTTDVVIKSERPLFEQGGQPEVGGFASFRMMALNRRARGVGLLDNDAGYDTAATATVHNGLLGLDLISSPFTVNRDEPLEFRSTAPLNIRIYDTHDWQGADPVQTLRVELPATAMPPPDIIVAPSYHVRYPRPDGRIYDHPQVQATRWWTFHRDGCIGRFTQGGVKPAPDDMRGRLYLTPTSTNNGLNAQSRNVGNSRNQRVPGCRALIYGFDNTYSNVRQVNEPVTNRLERISYNSDGWPTYYGTDSMRSLVPGANMDPDKAHGDARLIAAKENSGPEDWSPHPYYFRSDVYMAHNFSNYTQNEAGFAETVDPNQRFGFEAESPTMQFANAWWGNDPNLNNPNANYGAQLLPDAPPTDFAGETFLRYGDYDDSDPGGRLGPFINKPDEGNFAVGEFNFGGNRRIWRATYFRAGTGERYAPGSSSYFTPARMVTSPVMFGSLPTGVWDQNGEGAWRNLLFRPHVQYRQAGVRNHPGQLTPPDHYLLELFWMPVVEPYAISEPLSTAGKINMNYQMYPFTHIRRATGMHAVMKGEWFSAIPNADYGNSRRQLTGFQNGGNRGPVFRSENSAGNRFHQKPKHWHRQIVADRFAGDPLSSPVVGTLAQFDERFNCSPGVPPASMGLFRTPSQICELHLIPSEVPSGDNRYNVAKGSLARYSTRNNAMAQFWSEHRYTGDNTRESPYSNLYARLTTRSNTFRVHVRAQVVRKARSSPADTFNPQLDSVGAEYRGSYLLERYIETRDPARPLPDYAASSDPLAQEPLENFYRFRVLETKRFAP